MWQCFLTCGSLLRVMCWLLLVHPNEPGSQQNVRRLYLAEKMEWTSTENDRIENKQILVGLIKLGRPLYQIEIDYVICMYNRLCYLYV